SIFAAFSEQCKVLTIDFDTAICAYHSARIILFSAQTDAVTQSLSMPAALEKARFCQSVMNRFFRDSPVVEPMKRELEMLIVRHSSENSSTAGVQLPPPEEIVEDHLSRLADEARTRQRLAIHSLIGRADFVDDSNEVTTPAPPSDHHPNGIVPGRPHRQRSIRSNPNVKAAPHILRSHSISGA